MPLAPVEMKMPLFATVVEVPRATVAAAKVRLAVAATVLSLVRVKSPVNDGVPVPSMTQLAVFKVTPPTPLNVPLMVKPAVPVLLQVEVIKFPPLANSAPLST